MKRLVSILAAVLVCNVALAQVGTTVKEGAKATGEKAEQYGDQAKAAVSSQPNKAVDKTKAQVHKAKAHEHAKTAKDAGKEIPK
jgi:thiaminase